MFNGPWDKKTLDMMSNKGGREMTGKLIDALIATGHKQCIDCNTVFLVNGKGKTMCNNKKIVLCPWCRPDSIPWKNGRGI